MYVHQLDTVESCCHCVCSPPCTHCRPATRVLLATPSSPPILNMLGSTSPMWYARTLSEVLHTHAHIMPFCIFWRVGLYTSPFPLLSSLLCRCPSLYSTNNSSPSPPHIIFPYSLFQLEWIAFAVMVLPTIAIPFFVWYQSHSKYESLKMKKA